MSTSVAALLDKPATQSPGIREMLEALGHSPTLLDVLAPIYAVANGGTFFGGAVRVRPLIGIDDASGNTVSDTLTVWNRKPGWKRWHAFFETNDVFVFVDNALGDLFGVAVAGDGSVLDPRVVAVRTSAYEIETLEVGWPEFFHRIEHDADTTLARAMISERGCPSIDEVLSWGVPPRLGGRRSAENLTRSSLRTHVEFQLQVLHQALVVHGLRAGDPLPPIEIAKTPEGEMRVLLRRR